MSIICPNMSKYVQICPFLQPYHTQIKRCSFCVTYRRPTNSPGWAHLVVSYQDGRHVPLQGRKSMISRGRKQTASWQKPAKAYLFSVFIFQTPAGFMFRNHKESPCPIQAEFDTPMGYHWLTILRMFNMKPSFVGGQFVLGVPELSWSNFRTCLKLF